MPRFTLLVAGVLASALLAAPSLGASWENCVTGAVQNSLGPGKALCVDLADGDLDSDILFIDMCSSATVLYEPDTSGAGATTTVQIRSCLVGTVSTNCCFAVENATLDGNPATHTEALYDVRGLMIYVDGTSNPGAETPRVLVKCDGPVQN